MRAFFVMTCAISIVGGLVGAGVVSAQELPAGVLRMADGQFYQPSTGTLSADLNTFLPQHTTTTNLESGFIDVTSTPILPTDTATSTATVTSTEPVVPPLLVAVDRARAMLQSLIDADGSGKVKTEKTEAEWRPVTLAIWNPTTDVIRTVTTMKKGTSLSPMKGGGDISDIRVTYSNGLNSTFVVRGSDNELVVAIRYPIYTKRSSKAYDTRDVVYTPYSSALATPEVVAAGKAWLDNHIAAIYEKLRADGVKSRAEPDKLVADAIDPTFVKSIIFIEHLEVGTLKMDTAQLDPLYVTLATNKEDSFAFARSSVGAMGIVQFMPKTYAAVAKWKEYQLNPDFETGMGNATNAIKAEIAYLDYLESCVPQDSIEKYMTDPTMMDEVVAAAYNGGVTRAVKAMAVWDMNLDPQQRLHVLTRSRLKMETMQYVLKLRQVMGTLFSQMPTEVS